MTTATVTSIIQQIKKLSPAEKEELRRALGAILPQARSEATEENFREALRAAGLLSSPTPDMRMRATRRRPFKPVPVRGKPVSETLIEERR
ncbi:MAG: hypothetical protein AB7G75_33495 [Candidatus Binatia bacterium]